MLIQIDSYRRRPSVNGETPERGRSLNNDANERAQLQQNHSWTSALRDLSMVRGRTARYASHDSPSRGELDSSRDISMIRGGEGELYGYISRRDVSLACHLRLITHL